ncbi:MAG: hypothetical protein L3J39_07985 [Verrucomicrobiales bacterium]|nr:hypothetical protein [Verrucomicrobiales bacterium]
MSQVTIRRVEDEWIKQAKAEAKELGVSMNQVLVDALARGLGVDGKKKTNGLEKFAGCMPFESDEERLQWEEYMEELKKVNPADWK